MSSKIDPLLRNFPKPIANEIKSRLTAKENYDQLRKGVSFKEDKTELIWNVQMMNQGNEAWVRMSGINAIYAWRFKPSIENPQNIEQHSVISTQELQTTEVTQLELRSSYAKNAMPFFVRVISDKGLEKTGEIPPLPDRIHAYAKRWFEENRVPHILLPPKMPPKLNPSPLPPYKQPHEEFFLQFFQAISLLVLAYYTLKCVAYFF